MSAQQKDKRTKEQILRLLDHAMEQEERLSGKIKSLEAALAECRKKAEDPRHELTEEALSTSKVSFRIDYYRTAENGPLKGIIEHLPSRQNKAFEGEGQLVIGHFVNRFLSEEDGNIKKKKNKKEEQAPETPVIDPTRTLEADALNNGMEARALEAGSGESRLLHKLRIGIAAESGLNNPATTQAFTVVKKNITSDADGAEGQENTKPRPPARPAAQPAPRPSLLERLRKEHRWSLMEG